MKVSDLNELTQFFSQTEKLRKVHNLESLTKDRKPKAVRYKDKKDDCSKHLHDARFSRMPISNPKKWWGKKMPKKRTDTFRALPLDFVGADRKVSGKVIGYCHDRCHILALKHFSTDNLTVASKPLKIYSHQDEDGASSAADHAWEIPDSLFKVKEAYNNYTNIYRFLWPYDLTGMILDRLMLEYNWCSNAEPISKRIDILRTLFNETLRTNAERAVNSDCIMSYSEVKKLFKEIMVRKRCRTEIPFLTPKPVDQGFSQGFRSNSSVQNKNKKGFQAGRPPQSSPSSQPQSGQQYGGSQQNAVVKSYANVLGVSCCRFWNFDKGSSSCRNSPDPNDRDACRDSSNKKFMHLCNFEYVGKGSFCLGRHRRKDHR